MVVLIAPDKFKGTLTAQAAASLIAQGWREVRPADSLELLPMSDGGDGFGEVLAPLLDAGRRTTRTLDAARRPREASWWWNAQTRTALVESAQVIGLALLPPGRHHPFDLDTCGLGALVAAAAETGARRVLIGIGGSATNDGGFGMARSLGWVFVRPDGEAITQWTRLTELAHIEAPPIGDQSPAETLVAVDVQNPLLGPAGASRIYGPQKGLRREDLPLAEACLGRLAEVVHQDLGLDAAAESGAGAAGGLGFGLRCFAGARLESGFTLFARHARLEERIAAADVVITGEGAIDQSTLMGKGVGELGRLCRKHNLPCLALAGALLTELPVDRAPNPFAKLYGMAPDLTSREQAQADPQTWLSRLAAVAARDWSRARDAAATPGTA
jgi:glycerate 2-kinase